MILVADALLNGGELAYLRGLFDELGAEDGAETAEGDLKSVKHNNQLVLGERAAEIKSRVLGAFNRSSYLSYALIPKTVSPPLLNIYRPGMSYGRHTDAYMGTAGSRHFRCDISCTLFLDEPRSYDGGELCLTTDQGERSYKLEAGWGIFYPTQFIHHVNEVTRGERRACVMWFESFVRDPAKRWMLFELQQVRAWMEEREPVTSDMRGKLVNFCENLHRLWVET